MVRLPGGARGIAAALKGEGGFVVLEGSEVAAFVEHGVLRYEETIEITYLAVHAAHRRRGLGRRLVLAARDAALTAGASGLCLLTLGPSSGSTHYAETVAFYRAIGFSRTKELLLSDWNGAPALLMSAPLERLG